MSVDKIEYSKKENAVIVCTEGKAIIFAIFPGEDIPFMINEFKDLPSLDRFTTQPYEELKAYQDDWVTIYPEEA